VKKLFLLTAVLLSSVHGLAFADASLLKNDIDNIPAIKQTSLGKYLTSQQAYEILSAQPDIVFIDVRDPVEISLTGHPAPVDAIVPLRIHTSEFDQNLGEFTLAANPSFVSEMTQLLKSMNKEKTDQIIITCGSGMRSAEAARILEKQGYTDIWHIPDGYEGEEKLGTNTHNAWKLSGLPWSRAIIPGSEMRMIIIEK
jgi:rhodanese-related sulfurtransferase